jgi:hypothetical protein
MPGKDKAAMDVMTLCVQNAARFLMQDTSSKVGKVDGVLLGACPRKMAETTQLTTAFVCVQSAALS